MGLLDFFKRNKKLKTETVKTNKPSPEQTLFADTVLEIISPTVEQFGFVRASSDCYKQLNVSKLNGILCWINAGLFVYLPNNIAYDTV